MLRFICETATARQRFPLVFSAADPAYQPLKSPDRRQLTETEILNDGNEIQEHQLPETRVHVKR